MTIILSLTRTDGRIDEHELESDGDVVHIPPRLLFAEDIVGLDVEVPDRASAVRLVCLDSARSVNAAEQRDAAPVRTPLLPTLPRQRRPAAATIRLKIAELA